MIAFINSFLTYALLVVIFSALAFVGGFIGLKLRKSKDAKEAAIVAAETEAQ